MATGTVGGIPVACPACGEEIRVRIKAMKSRRDEESGRLIVDVTPDVSTFAEHLKQRHDVDWA